MTSYLFDFDGTLVDSMPAYSAIIKGILDELGVAYPEDIIKRTTPLGYLGTAKLFVAMGAPLTVEEAVARLGERLEYAYRYEIPAKATVIETMTALKAQGHSLNVLTASPHLVLDPCLKRLGLWELFDNVWSCEDFQTTKADPQIYLMAAQRLGVAPHQVTFLDDNLQADVTAKAAGVRVIGVYDESSADMEAQLRAACDDYIMEMKELCRQAQG